VFDILIILLWIIDKLCETGEYGISQSMCNTTINGYVMLLAAGLCSFGIRMSADINY